MNENGLGLGFGRGFSGKKLKYHSSDGKEGIIKSVDTDISLKHSILIMMKQCRSLVLKRGPSIACHLMRGRVCNIVHIFEVAKVWCR